MILAQCPRLPELCWSNQEGHLCPVRARVQKHWDHAATGDISGVYFIQGTSKPPRSSEEGREGEEGQGEEGPGQAGTAEEGTGSETEATVSTRIPPFWGTKKWQQYAPERPRREEGSAI